MLTTAITENPTAARPMHRDGFGTSVADIGWAGRSETNQRAKKHRVYRDAT